MYTVCKLLAQYHQQDKAKAEGRWIFRETEFTAEENKEIKENAKRIRETLKASNGKTWNEAMKTVQQIIPDTFIGFRMQDRILARCKANGIMFK